MNPIAILNINGNDHSILKVKEGYVVIAEKAEIKIGEYFHSIRYNTVDKLASNGVINPKECFKIIASTFPLEGVKRFEMVDEIEDLIKSIHLDRANLQHIAEYLRVNGTLYTELKRILKAAQSKGSFTEEQMLRLAIHCWNTASRPEHGKTYNINEVVDEFIQSLLPRYEVEMEEYKHNSCVNKCASYPSECLCKMEGIKPLTYEKEGVTYLKLKTVN